MFGLLASTYVVSVVCNPSLRLAPLGLHTTPRLVRSVASRSAPHRFTASGEALAVALRLVRRTASPARFQIYLVRHPLRSCLVSKAFIFTSGGFVLRSAPPSPPSGGQSVRYSAPPPSLFPLLVAPLVRAPFFFLYYVFFCLEYFF